MNSQPETLTAESLQALIGRRRFPTTNAAVVRPEFVHNLNRMFPTSTELTSALCSMKIHAMPGQRMPCWVFSDNKLLDDYLAGRISENTLEKIWRLSPDDK